MFKLNKNVEIDRVNLWIKVNMSGSKSRYYHYTYKRHLKIARATNRSITKNKIEIYWNE